MKDIVGYEGIYMITESGEVYSCRRKKFLKQRFDHYGYKVVNLRTKTYDKTVKVHRLVAEAFISNPDNKETVNHIDGNKENNSIDNLEWCTQKENVIHACKTGLRSSKGNYVKGNAKLNLEIVKQIRSEYKKNVRGCGYRELAKKYGVSVPTIKDIIKNRTWMEV